MNTIKLGNGNIVIREVSQGKLEGSSWGGPWRDVPDNGFVYGMFHRLLELSWIPVTERRPTEDDANRCGDVEWSDGKEIWEGCYSRNDKEATHWRRIVLP